MFPEWRHEQEQGLELYIGWAELSTATAGVKFVYSERAVTLSKQYMW